MPIADFSLSGRVAIVTGGSRGIGRSIALGLAEAGADVAIAARKPEALAEAVSAVEATGRRALGVPTNVRSDEALRALVQETRQRLGRVDVLVNNAGTNPVYGPLQDKTLFDRVRIDAEAQTLVWPNGADFDPATLYRWPELGPELEARAKSWVSPAAN